MLKSADILFDVFTVAARSLKSIAVVAGALVLGAAFENGQPARSAGAAAPQPQSLAWGPGGEIAFAAIGGGTYTVRPGSEVRRLTPLTLSTLTWSPDGRTLLGVTDRGIVAIDGRTGRSVRLGEGFNPAWSPDGRRIAFKYLGGYHVMNADGTGRRKIARGRLDTSSIAWAPNGKRLAYVRCTASAETRPCTWQYGLDVYTVSLRGGDERRITRRSGFVQCVAWSVRGLAFYVRDRIEVVLRSGRTLVFPGACPAWSPDGNRLASDPGGGLTVFNLERGTRRRFTITGAQTSTRLTLAWAPDGQAIAALALGRSGRNRIFVIRLRDGHVTAIG